MSNKPTVVVSGVGKPEFAEPVPPNARKRIAMKKTQRQMALDIAQMTVDKLGRPLTADLRDFAKNERVWSRGAMKQLILHLELELKIVANANRVLINELQQPVEVASTGQPVERESTGHAT